MTIHVINLDRDTERLRTFLAMNAHVPDIVRVAGVDGRFVDRASLEMTGTIAPGLRYSNGRLGCAASHIKLWRRASKIHSATTIVEDDAVFARNFRSAHSQLLEKLPGDWDVVLWGWNFDRYLWTEIPEGVAPAVIKFDQDALRRDLDIFRASDVAPAAFRLRHAFGLMAYSISGPGAKALLEICLPLSNVTIPIHDQGATVENDGIDCMMNAAFPRLKAYVCIPPLAVSENRVETSRTFNDL